MKTIDRIRSSLATVVKEPPISLRPIFTMHSPLSKAKQRAVIENSEMLGKVIAGNAKPFSKHLRSKGKAFFAEKVELNINDAPITQFHFDYHKLLVELTDAILYKADDGDAVYALFNEEGDYASVEMTIKVCIGHSTTNIYLWGSFDATSVAMDQLNTLKNGRTSRVIVKTITGFNPGMLFMGPSFSTSTSTLELDDKLPLGEDAFYPFLKDRSVYDFGKDFAESKANVVVFYGPPGNGKSTFSRTMAVVMGYRNIYICSDERVFTNELFSKLINDLPDNTILFLEDAYHFLKKRSDGNFNMSALLALADGVASRNIKFVISTNLTDMSEVEVALLREGRCYGDFEFANLTFNQANAARAAIDLPPLPRSMGNREMSLATALNSKAVDVVESAEQSNVIDLPVTQSAK
jgi:hypothetical protein